MLAGQGADLDRADRGVGDLKALDEMRFRRDATSCILRLPE